MKRVGVFGHTIKLINTGRVAYSAVVNGITVVTVMRKVTGSNPIDADFLKFF